MICCTASPAMMSAFSRGLVTAGAMSVGCGFLSLFVVLRRWAFIGEAIAHSGLGGIGTAWLLSLAFPILAGNGPVYAVAVLFCMLVACSIGYVIYDRESTESFGADSAIGIFLVASLAWGFFALAIYQQHKPAGGGAGSWESYLFGSLDLVSPRVMVAGLAISAAVVLCVAALFKELVCCSFDPVMARVSGVKTRLMHYLLLLLLAWVIVVGMQIAGNVLVTALLILPGTTALLLSRRLGIVVIVSVAVNLLGCLLGLLLNHHYWPTLPSGPTIVLVLFAEFLLTYLWSRIRRANPEDA
jgi:ABC-type Mn2+/Zn2+ transport system permease subunit